jgi:hypothetical protein
VLIFYGMLLSFASQTRSGKVGSRVATKIRPTGRPLAGVGEITQMHALRRFDCLKHFVLYFDVLYRAQN